MKKLLAMLALVLTVVVAGSNIAYAADENWTGTAPNTHYSISNGVITSDDSFIFLGPDNIGESGTNYFVTDEYSTAGDYTVSVNTKGTMGLPNDHEVKLGIVPYYLDENNFIYVYVHWAPDERPTDVRCVQFSGLLNGKPIELFDALNMEYLESKWNDCWCDGIQVPAAEELTIQVDKTNAGDNVVFSYVVSYAGSSILGSGEYTLAASHFEQPGKVGVMACGEAATFSNFSLVEIEEEVEEPDTDVDTDVDTDADTDVDTDKADSDTDEKKDDAETPSAPVEIIVAIAAVVVIAVVVVIVVSKKKKDKTQE